MLCEARLHHVKLVGLRVLDFKDPHTAQIHLLCMSSCKFKESIELSVQCNEQYEMFLGLAGKPPPPIQNRGSVQTLTLTDQDIYIYAYVFRRKCRRA